MSVATEQFLANSNIPTKSVEVPRSTKGYRLGTLLGPLIYPRAPRSQYRKHLKDYCIYNYITYYNRGWHTTSDSNFASSLLFPIVPSTKIQLKAFSGAKNAVSTFSLEGKLIRTIKDWIHLEAGAAIGTFPSILAGIYLEPTSTSLISYAGRYNISPIDPDAIFSHELLWRQSISENSEYRLKYAIDQEQRLGAKLSTNYAPGSRLSASLATTSSTIGCKLHHTTQLTDKLSIKIGGNARYADRVLFPQIISKVKYSFQSNISLQYGLSVGAGNLGVSVGPITMITSSLFLLGHYLFYRILFRSGRSNRKPRESASERQKRLEIKCEQRAKVKPLQEVMKSVAGEKAEIEARSQGLIIHCALFGKRSILEYIKAHHNPQEYLQILSGNNFQI